MNTRLDVGNGQLHEKLLNDKRVKVFEDTDIRGFDESEVPEDLDLIVIDVSFISIREIISNLSRFVSKSTKIVALIKPQFEVGRSFIKRGVVRNENEVKNVLEKIRDAFEEHNFKFEGEMKSPLKGKEGNQEYLFYLTY